MKNREFSHSLRTKPPFAVAADATVENPRRRLRLRKQKLGSAATISEAVNQSHT